MAIRGMLIAGLAFFFCVSLSTRADEPSLLEVQSTDCKAYRLENSKWSLGKFPAPIGASLSGKKISRSGKDWLLFNYEEAAWRAEVSCFELPSSAPSSEPSPAPLPVLEPEESPPPVVPKKVAKKKKRSRRQDPEVSRGSSLSLFSGALIWSESLTGATITGASLPLQSSNQGLRLGLRLGIPLSSGIDLGLELGGLLGVGEIYEKSAQESSAYRASGSHLGFIASPSVNFLKSDGTWGFGIAAPFMIRRSNWPDPQTGISLPPSSGLRSGLTVQTTLSSGSWNLMPQVGVLGSTSHWVFALDVGLRL